MTRRRRNSCGDEIHDKNITLLGVMEEKSQKAYWTCEDPFRQTVAAPLVRLFPRLLTPTESGSKNANITIITLHLLARVQLLVMSTACFKPLKFPVLSSTGGQIWAFKWSGQRSQEMQSVPAVKGLSRLLLPCCNVVMMKFSFSLALCLQGGRTSDLGRGQRVGDLSGRL